MPDSQRYPWKHCLVKYELDITVLILKTDYFQLGLGKHTEIIKTKGLGKRQHLPHFWSDKGFKGTLVNQTLPSLQGESLKIMIAAPIVLIMPFVFLWFSWYGSGY